MLFQNLQHIVLYEKSETSSPTTLKVLHITTPDNAMSIAQNGFSLNAFGQTSRKTGNQSYLKKEPKGVFLLPHTNVSGVAPPHPYDHREKGAYVYGEVQLKNPIVINDSSWWDVLDSKYGGKSGSSLTKALQKDGHDGIIVKSGDDISTIVVFDPASINVDKRQTLSAL